MWKGIQSTQEQRWLSAHWTVSRTGVTEGWDLPVSRAPGRLARDRGSLTSRINDNPERETTTRMR